MAARARPHPRPELDQSRIDSETILKRILLLLARGDLEGRRILFLGDDDGMAASLEIFKKHNPQFSFRTAVVDIDKLVLRHVAKYDLKHTIGVFECDLRSSIPEKVMNCFDLVVCDPPYTVEGSQLFLRRAIQCLHSTISLPDEGQDYVHSRTIYHSFSEKSLSFTAKVEKMILSEGLVIQEIIKRFNYYLGERLPHRYGNMWILRTTDNNRENRSRNSLNPDKIYTWQQIEGGIPRNQRERSQKTG